MIVSFSLFQRITGLDPAFIGSDSLQSRYARFVDIIHTDPNGFGTRNNYGHVDFWPNHGHMVQPGCPSSGLRARRRYNEFEVKQNRDMRNATC